MNWIEGIGKALDYIEENLTENITIGDIAAQAYVSPYYFQKGFGMLCGLTISDYLKQRRLTQAGIEIASSNAKVIDVALKYGYSSPDSFTKAFTRFHGITPTAARKEGTKLISFAPLRINFRLEGGYFMDYKIVKKEAFTLLCSSRDFTYEEAPVEIPKFWQEVMGSEKGKYICGMYGLSYDETMGGVDFHYSIADNYNPAMDIPEGLETKVIPEYTWAVFPCTGPMPDAFQECNKKIYSEWLPNCKDYEIAVGISMEMYSDPREFPKGVQDEKYYAELWIPVKKK